APRGRTHRTRRAVQPGRQSLGLVLRAGHPHDGMTTRDQEGHQADPDHPSGAGKEDAHSAARYPLKPSSREVSDGAAPRAHPATPSAATGRERMTGAGREVISRASLAAVSFSGSGE